MLLLVSWTNAHHEPRHQSDESEPEDHELHESPEVKKTEEEDDNTEIRHHIYMPYPLAYRQSAHPPTIQYVPQYSRQSALPSNNYVPHQSAPTLQYVPIYADPRFVSLSLGAYSNLGFARYVCLKFAILYLLNKIFILPKINKFNLLASAVES